MNKLAGAIAGACLWVTTTAAVWAGQQQPPAVDNDGGNDGLLLLVLVGAVIFAVAKAKAKPTEEGAPTIIDDNAGAGTGKY